MYDPTTQRIFADPTCFHAWERFAASQINTPSAVELLMYIRTTVQPLLCFTFCLCSSAHRLKTERVLPVHCRSTLLPLPARTRTTFTDFTKSQIYCIQKVSVLAFITIADDTWAHWAITNLNWHFHLLVQWWSEPVCKNWEGYRNINYTYLLRMA